MTLIGYRSSNHPQQVARRAPNDEVDDRATTPEVFAQLDQRFGPFTLDVAAAEHNAKCARFLDRQSNGLTTSWAGETVWCNPPYSDITPWVAKAWAERDQTNGIVMLLPANRTEQRWWQEMVEPFRDRAGSGLRVEFLAGRMRFLRRGQSEIRPNERPPFGVCLLIWDAS